MTVHLILMTAVGSCAVYIPLVCEYTYSITPYPLTWLLSNLQYTKAMYTMNVHNAVITWDLDIILLIVGGFMSNVDASLLTSTYLSASLYWLELLVLNNYALLLVKLQVDVFVMMLYACVGNHAWTEVAAVTEESACVSVVCRCEPGSTGAYCESGEYIFLKKKRSTCT